VQAWLDAVDCGLQAIDRGGRVAIHSVAESAPDAGDYCGLCSMPSSVTRLRRRVQVYDGNVDDVHRRSIPESRQSESWSEAVDCAVIAGAVLSLFTGAADSARLHCRSRSADDQVRRPRLDAVVCGAASATIAAQLRRPVPAFASC
jgi:hypothetical protein